MDSQRSLGSLQLDAMLQPGTHVVHNGQGYLVLERRHRYQFSANRYYLYKIDLYVQLTEQLQETTQIGDRLVLGDASCRYNAQSEMIRCAVNPRGPCSQCLQYAPKPPQV